MQDRGHVRTQNLERPLLSALKHFRPQVQGLNTEHRRLRFDPKVTGNTELSLRNTNVIKFVQLYNTQQVRFSAKKVSS